MESPPKSHKKIYITAILIELALVIWGFASASSENYGMPIFFSLQIILFWLPITLVAWFFDYRNYKKRLNQIEQSLSEGQPTEIFEPVQSPKVGYKSKSILIIILAFLVVP